MKDVKRLIGAIEDPEVIVEGRGIRELGVLKKLYGGKHWRKMKGRAQVETLWGAIRLAELHWYEAHGVGRRRLKVKRFLD